MWRTSADATFESNETCKTKIPSSETDGVVLSFCTAWICGIAFRRELLDPQAFTKISFGEGKIEALRAPGGRATELRHRGLFAWLSSDAPRLLRGKRDAVVLLVIWQERYIQRDEDDWELPDPECQDQFSDGKDSSSDANKRNTEEVVVEAYEMRCSRWSGKGCREEERMRAETTSILRTMSEYTLMLEPLAGGFRVDTEVWGGKDEEDTATVKLKELRRIRCGSLRIGDCEIACAILVRQDE